MQLMIIVAPLPHSHVILYIARNDSDCCAYIWLSDIWSLTVVYVVWIGSTSFARTQDQTQILKLYSRTTLVHLQMVLLHQHLSISQSPQLQSLLLIPHLELMVYDIMHWENFKPSSPPTPPTPPPPLSL